MAGTVNCGGSQYHPDDLAGSPDVSTLPEGPAGATDDAGAPAFDPSLNWRVVHQSDTEVFLIRELDEPVRHGEGDVRTHESKVLARITGASNVPDGTWLLTSAGPCAQRLAIPRDLGAADLMLADEPSADDTSIRLLVYEWACASGTSADGRVELAGLDLTDDQVRLRVGVHPREGEQTCQSNPPTSFVVELSEPIGNRQIVDASIVPARPIVVDDSE